MTAVVVFDELVAFPSLLSHPNLTIELLLLREDHIRRPQPTTARRRTRDPASGGWSRSSTGSCSGCRRTSPRSARAAARAVQHTRARRSSPLQHACWRSARSTACGRSGSSSRPAARPCPAATACLRQAPDGRWPTEQRCRIEVHRAVALGGRPVARHQHRPGVVARRGGTPKPDLRAGGEGIGLHQDDLVDARPRWVNDAPSTMSSRSSGRGASDASWASARKSILGGGGDAVSASASLAASALDEASAERSSGGRRLRHQRG